MRPSLVPAALGLLIVAAGCGKAESDPPGEETGSVCSSGVAAGPAVEVPAETWTWVPVEGSKCRDGSDTGIGVYARPGSEKLVIYLEGGGACFNSLSCLQNPSKYGENEFRATAFDGVLDVEDPRNPFADATVVYVPYCTGDVHAGSAEHVDMSGPNTPDDQYFVGHDNVTRALARLKTTFPGVKEVVLAGVSAGGFGTWLNYEQVADTFCQQTVVMLNDSGPAIAEPYLAACLEKRWRDVWNLAMPADCPDCTQEDGGGISNLASYLADKYPAGRFGLISSTRDETISQFFAFGIDDCANLYGGVPPTAQEQDLFETGLLDFRDSQLSALSNFSTYFLPETQHTWMRGAGFYDTSVNDTKLVDWVQQLSAGPTPPAAVGP